MGHTIKCLFNGTYTYVFVAPQKTNRGTTWDDLQEVKQFRRELNDNNYNNNKLIYMYILQINNRETVNFSALIKLFSLFKCS